MNGRLAYSSHLQWIPSPPSLNSSPSTLLPPSTRRTEAAAQAPTASFSPKKTSLPTRKTEAVAQAPTASLLEMLARATLRSSGSYPLS
ncbi:hypothetical protein D9615_002582 [Tricholomella constricta]|uniref:Uncharacterized protein n=1 Tax=Tricholomella constricta TaxID=117010 RepID=A0A8H5HMS6_9AGAR|nr:hypothetical protein D9615_002582 [Tricholomella constricta]